MSETSTLRRKYSPRRSREERREQLLDAALQVIDGGGFGAFTIEAVAREADLAKTVVYASFGNQEELLRSLISREQQRAFWAITGVFPKPPFGDDPRDVLSRGLMAVLQVVKQHPETWRLILLPPEGAPPAIRSTAEESRAALKAALDPVVAWGLGQIGHGHLDPDLASYMLIAAVEEGIRLTLSEPEQYTPERITAFADSLIATFLAQG
jgi:AcrR family transcriptional regulator